MSVEDGRLVFCGCGAAMLAAGTDENHVYVCPVCDPRPTSSGHSQGGT